MVDQRAGGITWTDETWNPIRGCRRVNTDCENCYAERLAATRLSQSPAYRGLAVLTPDGPRWTGQVVLDQKTLPAPLRWQRPRLIFVNAMSDLFYEDLTDDQIDQVVAVMALARRHTFQVLTKRPARMATYLADPATPERLAKVMAYQLHRPGLAIRLTTNIDLGSTKTPQWWPLPNVWWGASMGHKAAVQAMMPHLAACRPSAAVLWVSAEPLIEAIQPYLDFDTWFWKTCPTCNGSMSVPVAGGGAPCPTCLDQQGFVASGLIDWMVAGGESGPGARPIDPQVVRSLRDNCLAAGVAFHFKQWGEWAPVTYYSIDEEYLADNNRVYRLAPADVAATWKGLAGRIGRNAAGRTLDGKVWNDYPKGFTHA